MNKIILCCIVLYYGLLGIYFISTQDKLFEKGQLFLKSKEVLSMFEKCKKNKLWKNCYSSEFVSYNKSHTLEQTVEAVVDIQTVDQRVNNCHVFAHGISHNEMRKDTTNWRNTLTKIDPGLCGGGFIHGALESLRTFNPDFKMNKTNILDICTLVSDDKTLVDEECLHGVGHILVVEHAGDIDASQKICSEFAVENQRSCLDGVFMEYITGDTLTMHTGIQRKKPTWDVVLSQEKRCNEYSGLSSESCWQEMTHSYSAFINEDYKKAYDLCSRAPGNDEIRECYFHAIYHVVINNNPSFKTIKNFCTFYEKSDIDYERCINIVAFGLTHNLAFDKNRAQNYCKTLNEPHKKYCLDYVDERKRKNSDSKLFD